MYMIQIDKGGGLMIYRFIADAGPDVDGNVVKFHGPTMVDVRSERISEAIKDGKRLGSGKWFQTYAKAGDRITFRNVAPPPKGYGKKEIDKARSSVEVTVAAQEQYDEGPFNFGATHEDGSLDAVIASLEAIRESIPEPYRAGARCGIDSESGYEGSHYASIKITYRRPETDEEVVERLQQQDVEKMLAEEKERAELARLKKKLGEA